MGTFCGIQLLLRDNSDFNMHQNIQKTLGFLSSQMCRSPGIVRETIRESSNTRLYYCFAIHSLISVGTGTSRESNYHLR
jgi:hypothetical protein